VPSSYFAMVYLGLGRKDRALALLDKGYVERDLWVNLLKIDPFGTVFAPIRAFKTSCAEFRLWHLRSACQSA